MSDPRLVEWLLVTRAALEASDEERGSALESALQRRSALRESLEQSPPRELVSPELARELRSAEDRLQTLTTQLLDRERGRIEELRRVRSAARGYRPTRENPAAFVSKSV